MTPALRPNPTLTRDLPSIEPTSMESKPMNPTSFQSLVSLVRGPRLPAARRGLLGALGVLALVGLLGPVACGGGDEPEAAAAPGSSEPITVATRVATYRSRGAELAVTGTVEPSRRTAPGTKILGRVDRVPVQEGQRVAAGALLAQLESRDLQAAVRQAEAGVASAEAQLANSRAQFERIKELEAKGSATRKNLEDATSGFHMAQAGVEQARSNVEAAKVMLGYAQVRTPFAGWVIEKRIEEGDMVQPGAPLFTVEDLDPVKVIAEVPETEISMLSTGDAAGVEVSAVDFHDRGTIARIVPSGDRRSRTFRVEIRQPNPEGELKSGMFARVTFATGTERSALLVPASALVVRGQLEGVFVAEPAEGRQGVQAGDGSGTVARLRWVRTGGRAGDRGDEVEILSGLSEGETYVVDPPDGLVDGTPLETTLEPEATGAGTEDGR